MPEKWSSPEMRRGLSKRVKKHWRMLLAAAALACVLFGNEGFRQLLRNNLELRRAQGELAGLENEGKKLLKEMGLLKNDPAYLEKIARTELGLIKPGEIEYRFEKSE